MNALPIGQSLHHPLGRHPAALAEAASPAGGQAPGRHACGWFESSWDLQQDLAVSELPDGDGSVAALWFTRLDSSSAHLQ